MRLLVSRIQTARFLFAFFKSGFFHPPKKEKTIVCKVVTVTALGNRIFLNISS